MYLLDPVQAGLAHCFKSDRHCGHSTSKGPHLEHMLVEMLS